MSTTNPGSGVIYTETTVYSPPEQYINEAPYQIAIVALDGGGRLTARIAGDKVSIGDRVNFLEYRNQFPVFQK
ncbi:MAG: OB-fold domain-containing protein [Acidobacteria bacterium]|nr:OB-fold domain-containing protein [Acidobacteriota bacterium]